MVTAEIDFNPTSIINYDIPNLFVSYDKKLILLSDGSQCGNAFTATVVWSDDDKYTSGQCKSDWHKAAFKLFNGEIILKNK